MKKTMICLALVGFLGTAVASNDDYGSGGSNSNSNSNRNTNANVNANANLNVNRNNIDVANSNSNTNGNTNRNSNRATGGSATGGSGGNSNVNVNNSSTTNTPNIASSAIAPNIFHSGGVDSCMGSSSGSVQGLSIGVAFGSTWTDTHCQALRASVRLNELGLKKTAMARLCSIPEISDAFRLSGEFDCGPEKK
jgi:hypothetical protein